MPKLPGTQISAKPVLKITPKEKPVLFVTKKQDSPHSPYGIGRNIATDYSSQKSPYES